MNPIEFRRLLELNTEADEVFRWHSRPGAFERLGPPWDKVTLDGPAARLVAGDRQVAVVSLGPLKLRWHSEITEVEAGRQFQDIQLSGPFASWEHTHTMAGERAGHSTLEDRVRYTLPLGALGEAVAGRFVRKQLQRLFAYRHRITEQDLQRHQAADRSTPMDILVTGASGLVGRALCAFLTTGGHRVRKLVRRAATEPDEFRWDPKEGAVDAAAVEGLDAVVHLAGENIAAGRWTDEQKDRIRSSRVDGTRSIVNAIKAAKVKPKAFISASAIGFYGDRGDERLNEESAPGGGFLAEVVEAWEEQSRGIEDIRTVQLRFGVILSPAGGALAKMLLPFQMGGGGRIGTGKQWMSWIALDDVVGAIHHSLLTEALSGPVNAVAPNPMTNAEYTGILGAVLNRPTIFPMPAFAARLAFGEMADELLLGSQRVQPGRLEETGYRFSYPELEGALRHQLGRT
jgi:uncharacterized protein